MTHQEDLEWSRTSIMQGQTQPDDVYVRIRAFICAFRNLRGVNRAEVACRMPWDVAYELRLLGYDVATETADVSLLDNDEDFQYRLKHGPA